MSITARTILVICTAGVFVAASAMDSHSITRDGIGLRAGVSLGPDQVLIGAQGEFGPAVGPAYLVPSLDLGIDDDLVAAANVDLRWYLLPLPDTGIYIYGSVGPTIVLAPDTEVGLSLTAGLHVPMKSYRRYNVELRFGLGDIPDLKIVGVYMWGL
jgi:hypothetical protein